MSVTSADARKRHKRQRNPRWSVPGFILLLVLDVALAALVATKVTALTNEQTLRPATQAQLQRTVALIVQTAGQGGGADTDAPVVETGEQGPGHGMVVAVATAMLWSGVALWLHKAYLDRAEGGQELRCAFPGARAGGRSGTGADRPGREAERGAHAVAYGRARRRGSAAGDGDPPV